MNKVVFTVTIEKFDAQGEKTGWTYFTIPAEKANRLKPGTKTSFRIKGYLDAVEIQAMAILPMGGGDFILPLKADLRKQLGKRKGDKLRVALEADDEPFRMNSDFLDCLADAPAAQATFEKMPGSHQRYYSKWIDAAKTEVTRTKRIAMAVSALEKGWDFGKMLRVQAGREQS
ncbi:YdeI/OmpD-associated family protein [Flavihumibacter petaseus]|uniref:DUF1905 domain-containing protein n=1 Tax=Flavihumibacter petaseus NBRC 106054 TaxID=1220578 RepID=A0A0E9N0W5_9BACT|nr:YdeI/OmpD-associated family protein [Flavihumibacter petaseus]GAO43652.1 hypothetical protein FPE01S_02_07580 [Flavihumibacter petaseus NBRC 106054]